MGETILVVGSGSVGKRHAKNLASLGYDISCVDPKQEQIAELSRNVRIESEFRTLDEALLTGEKFTAMVVCSPPKYHIDQAIQGLNAGLSVLLEKPVGKTLQGAQKLLKVSKLWDTKNGPGLLLGYTWRWWPALIYLKKLISSSAIGQPYFARFHVSAHIADWHPWEDYRDFFMSSKDLGGGALLDESHWIDQMIWYFGMPEQVVGTVSKISQLDLTADDSVEMLALYKTGLKVSIHLDIFGRPHEKSIHLIGSKGTLTWTEVSNCVIQASQSKTFVEKFEEERNYMFEQVASEFDQVIKGRTKPTCTLSDGYEVLRIVEAIRRSNERQSFVNLEEI